MSSTPVAHPRPGAEAPAAARYRGYDRRLVLSLLVVAAVILGFGIGALLFRRPAPSNFAGAPSVTSFDLPAAAPARPAPPALVPVAVAEPPSARAALQQFLDAEVARRPEVSFSLLDSKSRGVAATVAGWQSDRATRLLPERFAIQSERSADRGVELTVLAERTPAVTPLTGLVPGRSEEVWRVVQDGGWRVSGGRPVDVRPILPPEASVRTTAAEWLERARTCRSEGTIALQLSKSLLGAPSLAGLACDPEQTLSAGDPVAVSELSNSTVFVSAYGPSVGRWARAVAVTGTSRFTIVLAPLGDEWRVMGLVSEGSPRP